MYQFFELLPGDPPARLYRPDRLVSLNVMCALLDTARPLVSRTPSMDLLVWIDRDCFAKDREPNPAASAVARAVFQTSAAAVCGPLLVTGGSFEQPTALGPTEADEAFAYLFVLEQGGLADQGAPMTTLADEVEAVPRLTRSSFGVGLDSACIALRWLEEPDSRDGIDLDDVTLSVAMTGDVLSPVHACCSSVL